jgi:hypothetical protein
MGKLDDIRKQREAQFAQQERESGAPARGAVAKSSPAVKTSADVLDGKCSECGKLKAVQSGLVVSHQKGLGKMCPGSRKAPE